MSVLRSVCVYCGSSSRGPEAHKLAARRLGRLLAEAGIALVYGGGRVGIMGLLADAVLAAGGEVVGIIPAHLDDREVGHRGVTRLEVVESMHARKQRMVELSDGFVVLPGGLGTLDETFEILTWRQLRLHDKPIVLADVDGYWRPFLHLFDHVVANGYATDAHRALLTVVDGVEDVLPALRAAPEPAIEAEERLL